MPGFVCTGCGQYHAELPAIAYYRPFEIHMISPQEREKRVKLTEDLCSIDDEKFIVRGVLELPIQNSDDHLEYGCWVIVSQHDFYRYLELWNDENVEAEPPFKGKLSGDLKSYPGTDLADVMVYLQSHKRPLFLVEADHTPLGRDQREGITMEKAHRYIEEAFPGYFNNPA